MNLEWLTADAASQWAERLWLVLLIVWGVLWFAMKRAKKREGWGERAQHGILVILGFWLLFGQLSHWGWLDLRVVPNVAAVWAVGLALTALGIGISLWARLSLGTNWSSMVT